jgi:hypothetical protein
MLGVLFRRHGFEFFGLVRIADHIPQEADSLVQHRANLIESLRFARHHS